MARTRRTKDAIFEQSLFNNNQDFENWRNRLIDMAVGRFSIEGLPSEIYEPYILRKLVARQDGVCFFYDEDLEKYICYEYLLNGNLDIYGQTDKRRVICPYNGYQRNDLDNTNSVVIKASDSGTPLINIIEQYARKLYVISRTIDVNVNAQKTPIMILCDENEKYTFQNLYSQYVGDAPVIMGSKDLFTSGSNIKALQTGAPYVANQLFELQSNIWNEYLTFLGISNVNVNKKERLITDEVNRSMGGVLVARNNVTRCIERGLQEANKMFGLNMRLLFASDEEGDDAHETRENDAESEDNGENE